VKTVVFRGGVGNVASAKMLELSRSETRQTPGGISRIVASTLVSNRTSFASRPCERRYALQKSFGVVDEVQQRAMGGLEFVEALVSGSLPLNPMAKTLGYDVVEAARGRVAIVADPHAGHLNPAGGVHGGLAATLLDSCMGLAVQSTLDKGSAQTTLEFKISFIRPITTETGPVRAEGRVISCGRRVGTAEGTLTDREGRVLAHGTTTCLIFDRLT
jgi:uncharacterized protein (TIGR00369 family)